MPYEWRVFFKEENEAWEGLEKAPMSLFSALEQELPAAKAVVAAAPGERRTDFYYDVKGKRQWGLKERHVSPGEHVLLELKVLLDEAEQAGETTAGDPVLVEHWSKIMATVMTKPIPSLDKVRKLRRPRLKTVSKQIPRLLKDNLDLGPELRKVRKVVKKARKSLKAQKRAAAEARKKAEKLNKDKADKKANKDKKKKDKKKKKADGDGGSSSSSSSESSGSSSSSDDDAMEEAEPEIPWSFAPLTPVLVDKLRRQVSLVRGDGKRRSSLGRAMTKIGGKLGGRVVRDGWIAKSYWAPDTGKGVKVEEAVLYITVLDGSTQQPTRQAWRSWCVEGGDPVAIADFVRGVVLPLVESRPSSGGGEKVFAGYPEFIAKQLAASS